MLLYSHWFPVCSEYNLVELIVGHVGFKQVAGEESKVALTDFILVQVPLGDFTINLDC